MGESESGQEEFAGIPNPTAEQCGMCQAYNYVYARMRTLEALEKSLTKPEPRIILIVDGAVGVHMQSPEARTRAGHGARAYRPIIL